MQSFFLILRVYRNCPNFTKHFVGKTTTKKERVPIACLSFSSDLISYSFSFEQYNQSRSDGLDVQLEWRKYIVSLIRNLLECGTFECWKTDLRIINTNSFNNVEPTKSSVLSYEATSWWWKNMTTWKLMIGWVFLSSVHRSPCPVLSTIACPVSMLLSVLDSRCYMRRRKKWNRSFDRISIAVSKETIKKIVLESYYKVLFISKIHRITTCKLTF